MGAAAGRDPARASGSRTRRAERTLRVTTTPPGSSWFGHPRGLSTLFFTEMWERFSYYGMRGFLILYMTKALSFTDSHAGAVYGNYVGSVWVTPILGGLIADRWLGQYRSVLIGGIIIAVGHFTLAFHALPFFYVGLTLIVIGTGLLKPNVSALVGALYESGDGRRDAGFSIFYMGINLGAFEQAGSTLALFADRYVHLEMLGIRLYASWFVSIQAAFVIVLSPIFAWLWVKLGPRQPSSPAKFALALL